MREYGAVSPQFWTGRTGRQIRKLGPMAQVIALYLLTAPGSTMLGLYYLPIGTIVHETGIPEGDVHETMADFDEIGFAHYDTENEVVWVVEMAKFQIAEELKTTDNRYKYVVKESPRFAASPLYDRWYDQYHEAFNLPERKVKARPTRDDAKGVGASGTPPFEGGVRPPHKPRQDLDMVETGQLNPRGRAPARESQPSERTELNHDDPAVPAERPAYLAMIATIADASGGKFDGAGVGSVLQQAFGAVLQSLNVDFATARRMGEMAGRPDRIWPTARGYAKGVVSLGWVMGKRDEHGTYNAPWVLPWVEAARASLAADAAKAARLASPPAAQATRPVIDDDKRPSLVEVARLNSNAKKTAEAPHV